MFRSKDICSKKYFSLQYILSVFLASSNAFSNHAFLAFKKCKCKPSAVAAELVLVILVYKPLSLSSVELYTVFALRRYPKI